MNLIAELLPLSNIVLDLEVSSKKRVFEQFALLFENNYGLPRSAIFDCLFEREKLGSTGIDEGVAIPHGRIKGLSDAVGAFIRTQAALPFDAQDGKPVNLFFALLVPEDANEHHLNILAELAHMFSDPDFREDLSSITETEAVLQRFAQYSFDHVSDHATD